MFDFLFFVCYNSVIMQGGITVSANIDKQQQILNFIQKQVAEKGYPPTVREICGAVGLNSPATVHGYLQRLEKAGHIIRESGSSRGLRLANVPTNISSIEKEYL